MEQLQGVIAQQELTQEPVLIGEVMVAMKLISPEQLESLLKAQAKYIESQRKRADQAPSTAAQAVQSTAEVEVEAAAPIRSALGQSPAGAAGTPEALGQAAPSQPARRATPSPEAPSVPGNGAAVAKLRVTGMANSSLLDSILREAVALGASDVHVHANTPILMRVHGELKPHGERVESSKADEMVRSLLVDGQQEVLDNEGQLDFAYEIAGVARFRCNAYRQQQGTDVILRVIPPSPPSLDQLGLPSSLAALANFHQGMVLITGPSGCGKSSTLAALVNIVNEERPDHILTIEDPIEYVHASNRCLVNQREVLRHTESFSRALRAALREDPDIIAIGELRDLETISLAITAAETGHLVFGTLHTNDTIRTINRLIGVFQPDEQAQIRTMLSESLKAVVSQRLVPRADGSGRVPALEILINNQAVGSMIRANKTFQLRSVLETGSAHGMMLLDNSLAQLVRDGVVARDVALRFAIEPSKFPN